LIDCQFFVSQTNGIHHFKNIRLGWDDSSLNYIEVARAVEEYGGKLIAVHARTRQQAFRGEARWETLAEIKQAISIPVIGNGDVRTVSDIERMETFTGCDGIMIGRAAIGNPWIFARQNKSTQLHSEQARVINYHLNGMRMLYGELDGVRLFRKHLARYLHDMDLDKEIRRSIMTCTQASELTLMLTKIGLVENPSEQVDPSGISLHPIRPQSMRGLRPGHSFQTPAVAN